MRFAPQVDWCEIRVSPGDYTCPAHGIITPAAGLVPHCAELVDGRTCMRIALRAIDVRGRLEHVEARPEQCGNGHPQLRGQCRLGTRPCQCTPAGFHRIWTCQCGDEQVWPPVCGAEQAGR